MSETVQEVARDEYFGQPLSGGDVAITHRPTGRVISTVTGDGAASSAARMLRSLNEKGTENE